MLEAWDELRRHPERAWVLLACIVVAVLHQALRGDWFIDDAAICFSYARNLAAGEGAVPWPGAERIEAISDPTWVLLLTGFQALGLTGFTVAKPLAMLFAVPTLFVTWRLAAHALPEHDGPGALVAPMLLAINAQYAIWSASGLENGLFCLLLALALWRTVLDVERGGFPWSAGWFLLLAWTRPEGILYAAFGGLWFALGTWQQGRGLKPTGTWLAVFWVPTLVLEAARIAYFAWPVPNTYWAKIENRGVMPLSWQGRGWAQLREWGWRLWHAYLVPLYVVGLTGVPHRWTDRSTMRRAGLGLGAVGLIAVTLAVPGWPQGVVELQVMTLLALAFLLPLLALGVPGGRARVLCGQLLGLGLVWAVVTDGDWMGAYRWMSLVSVPGSVLLAVGIVGVADLFELRISGRSTWGPPGWVAASGLVGILLSPNASQTRDHMFWNKNETTHAIKTRVDHTRSVVRRTFFDGPVNNLEVDQGAHLWWAPDYVEVDMAMLVDIPMGRHWYQQHAFIEEWVFEENPPTFAHVGGWWAQHTGFRRYPGWWQRYFHVPPHRDPRFDVPFVGVFARRDLVMAPPGALAPGPLIPLQDGVRLEGLQIPTPTFPGGDLYLEAPVSLDGPRGVAGEVQMVAFLTDESGQEIRSWRLPIGYDLLPQAWFRPGEVFLGRHALRLPSDVEPGTYDLGLLVRRADGRTLAPLDPAALPPGVMMAGEGGGPVVVKAPGEVVFEGVVRVLAPAALEREMTEVRRRITSQAAGGACEAAQDTWILLKRHQARAWRWHASLEQRVGTEIADCWARRAEVEPAAAVDHLARAHRWDHRSEELARVGHPVARRMLAEGREARRAEDWGRAYRRFADVLRFEPWHAWARRWAEEARDHRLGLTDDVRIGIGGDDNYRAAKGDAPRGR